MSYNFLVPFLLSNRRRFGGASKKKPKKTPKDNWFEECTADQCKQLCKACQLKVSGSKQELIARLLGHEPAAKFASNKKGSFGPPIVTLENCKDMCRERLLQVSGKKFDLVLRILQHDHGTGGESLKRAATETIIDEETGQEKQVAKKKRKTSNASPKVFYNRVQKKIAAVSQKKYQSYWGSKSHAPDVSYLMESLHAEVQPYLETNPRVAFELLTAIFKSLADNFYMMERPGYFEGMESMVTKLTTQMKQLKPHLTPMQCQDTAMWMRSLESQCSEYSILDYVDDDDSLGHCANYLLGHEEDEGESDADTKPPAVMEPPKTTKNTGALATLTNTSQDASEISASASKMAPTDDTCSSKEPSAVSG